MRSILIAAIISLTGIAHSQQKLTVIDQNYELAKRTAQQQQKLLIIDFYTAWCIPCKMLDKAIFKNDSISAEISKNFVVLKYDAENDSLFNLSLKHHVCSYPTTVVLTGEGKLINKMFGTGGTQPLVESYSKLLTESIRLSKQGKFIEGISTVIIPSEYPEFYKNYVRGTANIKPGDLKNYWANNNDMQSEISLAILAYFGNAPEYVISYFVKHKKDYEKRFGKADVKFIIDRIASEKFRKAINAKDKRGYDAAVKFAKQYLHSNDFDKYVSTYRTEMYIATGAWGKASNLIKERVKRKEIEEEGINYFCWTVYEKCDEKTVICDAVQMMKKVIDVKASFAFLDTYARLLAKNGNPQAASTAMKRAIAMGKESGEDTRESEEALSKF